jgi:hypothetical protein
LNNFFQHIPQHFADNSRVWIYQCNRPFTNIEVEEITTSLLQFSSNWKSHGNPVKGFGIVLFNQFILLMADESATGVSGCSTDSSVRLIKEIEKNYSVDLFDRLTLAFLIDYTITNIPLNQFQDAINKGIINEDSLYFNNTVLTKEALEHEWIVPVRKSWLSKIHLNHNQ